MPPPNWPWTYWMTQDDLELSISPCFHLTGMGYYDPVSCSAGAQTRALSMLVKLLTEPTPWVYFWISIQNSRLAFPHIVVVGPPSHPLYPPLILSVPPCTLVSPVGQCLLPSLPSTSFCNSSCGLFSDSPAPAQHSLHINAHISTLKARLCIRERTWDVCLFVPRLPRLRSEFSVSSVFLQTS